MRRLLIVLVGAAFAASTALLTTTGSALAAESPEGGLYCNTLSPSAECVRQLAEQASAPIAPGNADAATYCTIGEAHIGLWSQGVTMEARGYGAAWCDVAVPQMTIGIIVKPRPELGNVRLHPDAAPVPLGVNGGGTGQWQCLNTLWCGVSTEPIQGYGAKVCWDGDVVFAETASGRQFTRHINPKCFGVLAE